MTHASSSDQPGAPADWRDDRPLAGKYRLLFWCAALLAGFLQIWAHRHDMNPDGVSYLDMATAYAGWRGFVNGYWSPLYPAVLSGIFRIFHPALSSEATLVHIVNFAIFILNLACFELFLGELIRARREAPDDRESRIIIPRRVLWIWGYLFFIWAYEFWLRPALVTPDLCVAAVAYLATAILLRISRRPAGWAVFAALGAVLGVGYLAKAAMFPLAFVFLACSYYASPPDRRSLPGTASRTGLALLVFCVFAAPLVVALSAAKHRLTFGDSGAINYAEYINNTGGIHWQGGAASGTPKHPTRQVVADPPLYEFAEPVGGSYPPSYDLSYWSDGVQPHFILKAQLRALFRAANFYLQMFSRSGILYLVFVVLFLVLKKTGRWRSGARERWAIWLPAYAAFAMYALVHVEPRFVGEFALMLLMAIFAALEVPAARAKVWLRCMFLAFAIASGVAVAAMAARDIRDIAVPKPFGHLQIARGLQAAGVYPGEKIGVIGGEPGAYWARLAGIRIIAEIPKTGARRFWSASADTQSRVLQEFAKAGASAVVSVDAATPQSTAEWQPVPGTSYYLHR